MAVREHLADFLETARAGDGDAAYRQRVLTASLVERFRPPRPLPVGRYSGCGPSAQTSAAWLTRFRPPCFER